MKVRKIWMFLALILIGYSGGIITGVVIDADQVYHTTIKKLRQNKSPDGTIVVDVQTGTGEQKSKKELRQEKKEERLDDRATRKEQRLDKKYDRIEERESRKEQRKRKTTNNEQP